MVNHVSTRSFLFTLFLASLVGTAWAGTLDVTILRGAPTTLGAWLKIEQAGYPDLSLSPDFRSEPFDTPVYYVLRAGLRRQDDVLALEMIHHKLILDRTTPEIQSFTISHGYNILSLLRIMDRKSHDITIGVGLVIAHPESEIRGQVRNENDGIGGSGYHLTGPVFQFGLGRNIDLGRSMFLRLDGKILLSRANVPIYDGKAALREISTHLMAGLGYSF